MGAAMEMRVMDLSGGGGGGGGGGGALSGMQEQLKLLLSNFQIMGSFGATFGDVEWPDLMATFQNIKDSLEFDIMALFAVDCFDDAGYLSLYWLVGSVVRLRCRKTFEGDGPSDDS